MSTNHETTNKLPTFNLSIKLSSTKYTHFSVPKEVYDYVRELENHIAQPEKSELLVLYADRFDYLRTKQPLN